MTSYFATTTIPPFIPQGHWERAFQNVLCLAHNITWATTCMLSQQHLWSRLAKPVQSWCRQCNVYNRVKVTQHTMMTAEKI